MFVIGYNLEQIWQKVWEKYIEISSKMYVRAWMY